LNRSALLKSLLGLAVLAGAGYLWHRYSVGRVTKALHDYAEQCAEKKDYANAATQFSSYVQLCPNDAAGRLRLAETYDRAYSANGSRVRQAIVLYQEALGIAAEEKKPSIHIRLGELLLQTRQYVLAAAEADAILQQPEAAIQDGPQAGRPDWRAKALNLMALALYGQARQGAFKSKLSEIGANLETALKRDSGERETAVALARVFREEPKYLSEEAAKKYPDAAAREKEADQIIDRLVAARPAQPEVYLARYQYRMQRLATGAQDDPRTKELRRLADDDLKAAQRLAGPDLKKALDPELKDELDPKERDALLAVLLVSADAFRRDAAGLAPADAARPLREALALYEKSIKVADDDPRGYLGLGETQRELGQMQAAIDAWELGLKSARSGTSQFDMLLADALTSLGRWDEAEKHLQRSDAALEAMQTIQVSAEKARLARQLQLIRAAWFYGKGEPFKAIALAHGVATGATVTAAEVRLALKTWLLLAGIDVSIGRWADAAQAYEKVVELDPKSGPAYRALAAIAWKNASRPERAARDLRLVLASNESSDLRLALAEAIFQQNLVTPKAGRDWQAVQDALLEARLAHAARPLSEAWRLDLLEAEVARARAESQGRHAEGIREAAAIYRRIKPGGTTEKATLEALAMAFEQLDLRDDVDRTLAQWDKIATPREARMLRAKLAVSRKRYDEARRLVQSDWGKLSAVERSNGQRFLVQLSLVEGDMTQARADLDALTDFGPADLDLLFAHAELALERKLFAEVDRCRRKMVEMEGDNSRYGLFLQAGEMLAQAASPADPRLRDARELIDRLYKQYPDWPSGLLLRARLLDAEGRGDEAIKAYAEAIRQGESGIGPYGRLIDLLDKAKRTAELETQLDALREQSIVAERADALEPARRGDREKALEIIRGEAQRHPGSAFMQISLGETLLALGRSAEAVAVLERTVETAPDNLAAIRALALGLSDARQPERVRQVLAKLAQRRDLPEAQKQLAIAEIDEILGDREAARAHYQAACDAPPSDPAVRLGMVEFLRRSPRKEDVAAGETLLRTIVSDSPSYAPASHVLAGILAGPRMDVISLLRRGGPANRRRAQQILDELVHRSDANMSDRMVLAKLEEEDGRVEEARANYAVLASRSYPPPDQLVAYADFLLRHGPPQEADVQIGRLERRLTDDLASLALRVRWLHAQRRDVDIGPLLEAAGQRWLKAPATGSGEEARHCTVLGALYELGEQYAAAERWYRRLLQIQPDSFERLAIVLAKQKRGGEAVSTCLDAAKRGPPARAAMTLCSMRAAGQIGEQEFQDAAVLLAAVEKDKPSPQFLVSLAAARVVQERTDEAIALYQKVLAAAPQDLGVLNNLATLLGERKDGGKEALELVDRAINLAGPQGWLLDTKGEILLRNGKVDDALPMLEEAASVAEPDPRVLLHLAEAYRCAGKLERARKALEDAEHRNLHGQLLTPGDRRLVKELNGKFRG
jgi:tetratricopeptide (TPR) repeat protein